MKWLLVIIIAHYSGGAYIETVPYENKTACESAALGIYTMNPTFGAKDVAVTIDTKCVLGPAS